ncbi:MAG: magnesium/cobalt transporter CorA [Planctomycetota bacterium]|nr:magnesium/cobalt transporter CorA [Planctomycetota bacterium]
MNSWIASVDGSDIMSKLLDLGTTAFKKRHPEVGARPGTLIIADDAPPPKIRMISYDRDECHELEINDANQLAAALDPGNVTWVDVQGFGDETLVQQIGEIFQIHPLALEDIINMPQRPKAESYGSQVLVITRMVRVSGGGGVDMEQVSLLLGESCVVTFQERYGDILDPVRERIRIATSRLRQNGPGYLAYAIIDTIVDGYYPVIEAIGDHLEQLENVVMEKPSTDVLRELNRTKNMLVNLRRAVWPQREAVNSLRRDENALITDEVRVFFRDTYDHCVQTAEVIEMYREMATGLMNTYLSSIANRTNEVMKVLTIMASIFIPLTFLAGIYGMNFEHMPELHVRWAYPMVWIMMLVSAGGMIAFFWRKGWLGGGQTRVK